jgi:phospholipid/cholesterol/gamma-HCH transport system permease protein
MENLDYRQEKDALVIVPHGSLNAGTVGRFWEQTMKKLKGLNPLRVVVDGSDVATCDGAGIAFLLELKEKQERQKRSFVLQGFRDDLTQLVNSNSIACNVQMPARTSLFREVAEDAGRAAHQILADFRRETTFLGELAYRTVHLLVHPRRIRWGELFLLAEKAGANGVVITALLGFLIGLILAFQSAVALAMFGAQIYVADLVVLCMFRELGPLISGFILASRSGSAYAAELGTMKINEELDALATFGLDPMQFLIVPRVVALVLVLPLLTLFNNLFSLLGAELVMIGLGFSPVVFWDHVTSAAGLNDLFGGLLKTFVFGFLIGAVGCLRGMQTGKGASAVGDSATRAVVACMVMLVFVDFIFAVVYYSLGI